MSDLAREFERAVAAHQGGQVEEAERVYREVIAQAPEHSGALHLLGVVHLQRGEHDLALDLIGRAIAVQPDRAVYFNNYGAALFAVGRLVEALACFHRSAAIQPEYADAISNLGMAYESLGDLTQAARFLQQALELNPKHVDARNRLLALLQQTGSQQGFQRCYESLLASEPSAALHLQMGNLLLVSGKPSDAIEQYEKALALNPDTPAAIFNLGNAYEEQQQTAVAQSHFLRAAENHRNQPWWQLRAKTACPAVFQTVQEIDDFLGNLAKELREVRELSPPGAWPVFVEAGAFPNFSYSYLGRNMRPLKEQFSDLYQSYFQNLPEPEGSHLKDRKRIGFVITQRHEGIFLRCMTGILQGLSPQEYELIIIASPACLPIIREALKLPHVRYFPIPSRLDQAAHAIRLLHCDVIYYWEAGSDSLNYFLPFCRLAPVQCTSHGSQITSGNPSIEYFFSSAAMEIDSAQEHYSEKLWNARSRLMHQPRLVLKPAATRDSFRLPDNRTWYACLQNPLKYHPDFDPFLAGVLRGDPNGIVILLKGRYDFTEQALRTRFQRTMSDVSDRIYILPYLPFADYCQLLSLADVVLDPVHFGHGSSSYDVFSFNLPLVTFPTAINVGRVGLAFNTALGLAELVASSCDEYIQIATRLGRERDYCQDVKSRIAAASDSLFNDSLATAEHTRFFREISAQD